MVQSVQPEALIGATVDEKFEILELLSSGATSVVYKARHRHMDRLVALKVMNSTRMLPNSRERTARELTVLAKLKHPNIIVVYGVGTLVDERIYLALEYVESETLADLIRERGRLSLEECVAIFEPIMAACQHAHHEGILHRDLKPQNILVQADGTVKVVDFGLAKIVMEEDSAQKLTRTGTILGTPLYMAPEQGVGSSLGFTADIYSLGCVLYECLSGRTPYRGDSSFEVILKHMNEPVPLLDNAGSGVNALIKTALAKDPQHRFASMSEFAAIMRQVAQAPDVVPTSRNQHRVPSRRPIWSFGSSTCLMHVLVPILLVWLCWLGFSSMRATIEKAQRAEKVARIDKLGLRAKRLYEQGRFDQSFADFKRAIETERIDQVVSENLTDSLIETCDLATNALDRRYSSPEGVRYLKVLQLQYEQFQLLPRWHNSAHETLQRLAGHFCESVMEPGQEIQYNHALEKVLSAKITPRVTLAARYVCEFLPTMASEKESDLIQDANIRGGLVLLDGYRMAAQHAQSPQVKEAYLQAGMALLRQITDALRTVPYQYDVARTHREYSAALKYLDRALCQVPENCPELRADYLFTKANCSFNMGSIPLAQQCLDEARNIYVQLPHSAAIESKLTDVRKLQTGIDKPDPARQ